MAFPQVKAGRLKYLVLLTHRGLFCDIFVISTSAVYSRVPILVLIKNCLLIDSEDAKPLQRIILYSNLGYSGTQKFLFQLDSISLSTLL